MLDFGSGTGELAEHVAPGNYTGYDTDLEGIAAARRRYPHHVFSAELPPSDESFDTIVLLAVIEHIQDPHAVLRDLKNRLATGGRIVLTTMSPGFQRFHEAGARIRVFSREAAHEHSTLFDQQALRQAAENLGLSLALYKVFLLGGNQLAVVTLPKEGL